jgi:hypothetical protein
MMEKWESEGRRGANLLAAVQEMIAEPFST